jgi:hypothetical protein
MNGRDHRLLECRESVEQRMPATREGFALRRVFDAPEFLDIGAGNPRIALTAHEHRARNAGVLFDARKDSIEHGRHPRVERIHRRRRLIVGDDCHAVLDDQ